MAVTVEEVRLQLRELAARLPTFTLAYAQQHCACPFYQLAGELEASAHALQASDTRCTAALGRDIVVLAGRLEALSQGLEPALRQHAAGTPAAQQLAPWVEAAVAAAVAIGRLQTAQPEDRLEPIKAARAAKLLLGCGCLALETAAAVQWAGGHLPVCNSCPSPHASGPYVVDAKHLVTGLLTGLEYLMGPVLGTRGEKSFFKDIAPPPLLHRFFGTVAGVL